VGVEAVRVLFAFFIFMLAASVCVAEVEPQRHSEIQPDQVTNSGGFNYSIPIEVPEYRGIQPALALRYNSTKKSRSSAKDIVGIGWRVAGFSEIERVSQKLGSPTYNDADDIFLLDGQPLMACEDPAAITKWGRPYPARFQTDRQSASCLAGGNFSTMRESDRKIWFDAENETFAVFGRDGTRYLFKSLKSLSGLEPAAGSDVDKVLRSKWLLAEIRDAQQTANVVTFSYHMDIENGYAYRPGAIRYARYSVHFGYDVMPNPQSQWATGTMILGRQMHRLISIRTYNHDDTVPIVGVKLHYQASPEIGASLLTKVERYGRDFSTTGEAITGGSVLPGPHIMTYADDTLGFDKRTYEGVAFSTRPTVWDSNGDGRDDLYFRHVQNSGASCRNDIVQGVWEPYGFFRIGSDKSVTAFQLQGEMQLLFPPTTHVPPDRQGSRRLLAFLRLDASSLEQHLHVTRTVATNHRNSDGDNWSYKYYDELISPAGEVLSVVQGHRIGSVGNFDLDPETELSTYDISDGQLFPRTNLFHGWHNFDIDGDGMTEGLRNPFHLGHWTITDPTFTAVMGFSDRAIVSPIADIARNYHWRETRYMFADVTGDGKDDVIIHVLYSKGPDEISVAVSTGQGFAPRTLWAR